ncbi:hypothetical protein NEDG_02178 [Nematocida displodere]|uniref:NADPH-dependent diflavin oxidoreductase 1 n=1 Tax=Nematocida displodere TaxID=1805483 RepID=A0A177ELM7_9MICR|nr:hypothetical protein NEDG_02178 [Nematocida displodere]
MVILVAYGTQGGKASGTATYIRHLLERDFSSFGVFCEVVDIDSLVVAELDKVSLVIFVCSTTGDGDAPYNMQSFWWELKRKVWTGKFPNLYFAVVGLGDSSYRKFNYAGKRLFNRMEQLGSLSLAQRCDCDDMDPQGVYTALGAWWQSFKAALETTIANNLIQLTNTSHLALLENPENPANPENPKTAKKSGFESVLLSKRKMAPYGSVDDLTKKGSNYSEVIDFSFQIDRDDFTPGDVLAIYPENNDYEDFIKEFVLSGPVNREMFKKEADYQSVPMFHSILDLYQLLTAGVYVRFNSSSLGMEKTYSARLKEISESYDLYYDYILKPQRTYKEVLRDFYLQIDGSYNFLPKILPRYYTISKREENRYTITVGIVKRRTSHPVPRQGLCSEYLKGLSIGGRVLLDIKPSLLDLSGELLLICTGTGISLPRCTINEYLRGRLPGVTSLSVVFGFRSLLYDFLCWEELTGCPENSADKLNHLSCANLSSVVQHRNGALAVHFEKLSVDKKRRVSLFIAPSRVKEDIFSHTQNHTPKDSPQHSHTSPGSLLPVQLFSDALDKVGQTPIKDRNYIDDILKTFSEEALSQNIVVSGNIRLSKTVPAAIEACTGKKPSIQAECW